MVATKQQQRIVSAGFCHARIVVYSEVLREPASVAGDCLWLLSLQLACLLLLHLLNRGLTATGRGPRGRLR